MNTFLLSEETDQRVTRSYTAAAVLLLATGGLVGLLPTVAALMGLGGLVALGCLGLTLISIAGAFTVRAISYEESANLPLYRLTGC